MVNITEEDYQPNAAYTPDVSAVRQDFKEKFCDDVKKRIVTLDAGPRPGYYGGKDNPYEVFKVLEAWDLDKDFYLGNVIKYLARAGKKDSTKYKEDLQKAVVYLQKRIESLDK